MNIQFTLEERFAVERILNSFKGSISLLALVLEDIKKISLSKEEVKKIEGKYVPRDGGVMFEYKLSRSHLLTKDIDLHEDVAGFIIKSIEDKSIKNEITIRDKELINIKEKLEKK